MKQLLSRDQINGFQQFYDAFQVANYDLREKCKALVNWAVIQAGGKITLEPEFVEQHDEYIDFQLPYSKRLGQGDRVAALDAERVYSYELSKCSQVYSQLDTETWISLVETLMAYQRWKDSLNA